MVKWQSAQGVEPGEGDLSTVCIDLRQWVREVRKTGWDEGGFGIERLGNHPMEVRFDMEGIVILDTGGAKDKSVARLKNP